MNHLDLDVKAIMSAEVSSQVHKAFNSLRAAHWFSTVGQMVDIDYAVKPVHSWDEAISASSHPGSAWCNMEGRLILYRQLSGRHYKEFVKWNDVARAHLPYVESIMRDHVIPSLPELPGKMAAVTFVQSILTGAMMEINYANFVDVNLFRRQLPLLLEGHFPCGWALDSADEFPDQAQVCVF